MFNRLKTALGLKSSKTPSIESYVTRSSVENYKYSLAPITQDDAAWLNDCRSAAVGLIERYDPAFDGSDQRLAASLDRTFEAWMKDPRVDRAEPAFVVNALGAMSAELAIRRLGFEWCWLTDEQERLLAIHHRAANKIAYPMNTVQKRVDSGDWGFFERVFDVLAHEVNSQVKN